MFFPGLFEKGELEYLALFELISWAHEAVCCYISHLFFEIADAWRPTLAAICNHWKGAKINQLPVAQFRVGIA